MSLNHLDKASILTIIFLKIISLFLILFIFIMHSRLFFHLIAHIWQIWRVLCWTNSTASSSHLCRDPLQMTQINRILKSFESCSPWIQLLFSDPSSWNCKRSCWSWTTVPSEDSWRKSAAVPEVISRRVGKCSRREYGNELITNDNKW